MLTELRVKNLALIEEEDILFDHGLNILTGETGAGKSIILGALSLALGQKADRGMLRDETKEALVEATFTVNEREKQALMQLDLEAYEDQVILTRKIGKERTVARINGETVPAPRLKQAGAILLDIYGQKEHQSLLSVKKHMELVDDYARKELASLLPEIRESYGEYKALIKEQSEANLDEGEREREKSFLELEISQIRDAQLKDGEDEALEEQYRRMANGQKIQQALSLSENLLNCDGGCLEQLGRSIRELHAVSEYDGKIAQIAAALSDAESIALDAARDLENLSDDMAYDPAAFEEIRQRLDLINTLKSKFGPQITDVLHALEEKEEKLSRLCDYDHYLADLEKRVIKATGELEELCKKATSIRQKAAGELSEKVREALLSLNFLQVSFEVELTRGDYTEKGWDQGQFMISVNPGEPIRPLVQIASGGEMSRIMLALKTVLAGQDDTQTMIFDEIDSGISGRTAQAVGKMLSSVAREHQVILITHLPQIAARSNRHFLIEKEAEGESTVSSIRPLDEEGVLKELSRMLGGDELTRAVYDNARELRARAKEE
ncbi:MAG: DNA repair protein RecN [Lachnospiraceae bacterium]|nr:DNA repair protein RecN [Lachnospiraceae bacterium]MBQ5484832.1 DNA repair protein RecN [Lachnospiraceae bacterium]MEE3355444.1 DNA repair protein RecN [Candidatus Weimeria sp.]